MKEQLNSQSKLKFIRFCLYLLFFLLILKAFYFQVIKGEYYRLLSFNNFTRTILLPGRRGQILDKNGKLLCENRVSFTLMIDTSKEGKLDENIQNANRLLGLNLTRKDIDIALRRSPVKTLGLVVRDIPLEWVQKIEANKDIVPMFQVEMELRREYKEGKLFGHILGYVGLITESESKEMGIPILDPFQEVGKAGVEKSANSILMGKNGWKRIQVNSLGREVEDPRLKLPGIEEKQEPTAGKTIHLTVDYDLQNYITNSFGEESGSAVFMNPKTGEIYSYVSFPSIDPNIFSRSIKRQEWEEIVSDPSKPLINRPIQATYPAGSTFKPFIASVGLEEGDLDSGTTFSCSGVWEYGGNPFHCWAKGGHGNVDLITAIQNSCNIFFYKAGDKIGIDAISKWGRLYGFGGLTGIDLPNEKCGILPSREWKRSKNLGEWYNGETLPVAIGQGYLAVTPMQILSFYSTVANDGVRMKPHIVEGDPQVIIKVPLSLRTISILKEGLSRVVSSGTGRKAQVGGFEVCGKTGTAQIVKASAGKNTYSLDKEVRDHAWFAGFAPKNDPKVSFVIMVEHGGHGGDIAAQIAKVGLEYILLNKKPEEVKPPEIKPVQIGPEIPSEEQVQPKIEEQPQEEQNVTIDTSGEDDVPN
jgi:penicillin-binding protein 2